MSENFLALVFGLDISPAEKLVLLALADDADTEGLCFPKYPELSRRTGYAEDDVKRVIEHIKESGLIEVDHNFTPKGKPFRLRFGPDGK